MKDLKLSILVLALCAGGLFAANTPQNVPVEFVRMQDGMIIAGKGGRARAVDMSGDATITADGVVTVTGGAGNLTAGKSGTPGYLRLFPTTAAKGSLKILAAEQAGDTICTITNASQSAARIYTVPDAGADCNFVMTTGSPTITGTISATGFTGPLTGAVTGNASTATALATPRAINGVNFDGSAAINVCPYVLATVTSDVTVNGTATETVLLSTGLTGAAYFTSSSMIHIEASGVIGTFSTIASITLHIRMGTNNNNTDTILATLTPTATVSQTSKYVRFVGDVTLKSATTATAKANTLDFLGTAGAFECIPDSNLGAVTITNVSSSQAIGLYIVFGTSNAANTITINNASITLVKK